jgi:hypothetical protein
MVLAAPHLDGETITQTFQTFITLHHHNAIAKPAAPYLASTTPQSRLARRGTAYPVCYRDKFLPTNWTICRLTAPGNVTYFNCRTVSLHLVPDSVNSEIRLQYHPDHFFELKLLPLFRDNSRLNCLY